MTDGRVNAEAVQSTLGRVLTAMVTPFDRNGAVDLEAADVLARALTRDGWNDGLVVNGTTGESTTTSDDEKHDLVAAVRKALPAGVRVVAGSSSADTKHSIDLAQAAEAAGADGLLLVAPYYSRPSQEGVLQHFVAIADSTALPVMLYNIPRRTGITISTETLVEAATHERIIAVKDASGDFESASAVLERTDLAYYSGEDLLNLPYLSIGFTGFVSVIGHLVGGQLRRMLNAVDAGDFVAARRIHRQVLPLSTGMFRAPAAASAKFGLEQIGLPGGEVRRPLMPLTEQEKALLMADLAAADVLSSVA